MDFIAVIFFFIILAFLSLFFDLWGLRAWLRLLIWGVNVLVFCWLANLWAGIAELQITADEGSGFMGAMCSLMGIAAPQRVFPGLPEVSASSSAIALGLVVIGVIWILVIVIVLLRGRPLRFTRTLLFGCILFNVICQSAYLQIKRREKGALITMQYYHACKAEIARINTLEINETEKTDFYQEAMKDFRWTYEKAGRNYESMERLSEKLKAFPTKPQ